MLANGEISLDWLPENLTISEVSLEIVGNFADGLKLVIREIPFVQKMQIFKLKALKS